MLKHLPPTQGKENVILTNNSKGKFPQITPSPFPPPSYPPLFSYIKNIKIYHHLTFKGFVFFFVELIVIIARPASLIIGFSFIYLQKHYKGFLMNYHYQPKKKYILNGLARYSYGYPAIFKTRNNETIRIPDTRLISNAGYPAHP